MLNKKIMSIVLTGSVLIGGSSIGWADTNAANLNTPENVIPISAPVKESDLLETSFKTKFTDIEGHWAYEDIVKLESKGIFDVLKPGNFEPGQIVTKKEFTTYLDKIFALPGIIVDSEQPVTRIEVAKAIEKAFVDKKLSVIMTLMFPVYADTQDLQPEESSALSFVFNTGIMKGRTEQEFAPNASLTRAEMAAILNRTLSTIELAQPMEENLNPNEEIQTELTMEGVIGKVIVNEDNSMTGILVENQNPEIPSYDKVVFLIAPETKIFKEDTEKNSLEIGQSVKVTYLDGPVADIYPVRIEAKVIEVINN